MAVLHHILDCKVFAYECNAVICNCSWEFMMEIPSLVSNLTLFFGDLSPGFLPVLWAGMRFVVILFSWKALLESPQSLCVNFNPSRVRYGDWFFKISKNTKFFQAKVNRDYFPCINNSWKYRLINHAFHSEWNTVWTVWFLAYRCSFDWYSMRLDVCQCFSFWKDKSDTSDSWKLDVRDAVNHFQLNIVVCEIGCETVSVRLRLGSIFRESR